MREAQPVERAVGMDYYVSDADGVGGRLRDAPEDFRVRELEAVDAEPLDADPGPYPHLVVRATLRDWETNAFARELADRLGVSRERVSWAGTKDKAAVTTQLLSVDGIDPEELPPIRDADLEPVGRTGRPVLFGDLAGNEFEITVRDPDRPGGVDAITDELREFGGGDVAVPNYFGQQRFGSRRPITHAVGLRVVRGDWKGAVMTYVGSPHDAEPADSQAARRYVEETEDWQGGLDRMPDRLRYERAMLHALADGASFRTALETAPTNLQRLFVNAAQSFLFNRILSARLERGLPFDRAVAGDVVCFATERAGLTLPDTDRPQRATESRLAAVNRHLERGRAFVTAPLVGTDTELADGEPGEIERAVLDDLDLEPEDFDAPGEFGSAGTRRAIHLRPTEFHVERDPLRLSFVLPPGSYATVVLREYLKADPGRL